MAFWSSFISFPLLGLLSILLFHHPTITTSTFANGARIGGGGSILLPSSDDLPEFCEAPAFRNSDTCRSQKGDDHVHIVLTLDVNYIRGTMAAVLSMLQHSTCPENLWFHFVCLYYQPNIFSIIKSTFPYLNFKVYYFDSTRVRGKISKSIRLALDQPLNYARIYLSEILPPDVQRVLYLDSDIIVVDDISKLYGVDMDDKVVAAPEYCHANFTRYFTDAFWSDQTPIMLVMAGDIKAVDHRWNQHGLGGDNLEGKCRGLHPGPISLLHWSGKGKPWLRLDTQKPCAIDHLWAPYDLYRSSRVALEE